MFSIFSITLPFFALIFTGYLATRRRWLPLPAIGGLNAYVLYFALPCMLFRFGAHTPASHMLNPPLALVYLSCGLLLVALTVVSGRWQGLRWKDAAFGALVAAFPNTGFMGVPLLVTFLGPAAAGPVILSIVLDMVVTSSLCITLSRLDGASGKGLRQAALDALQGVLRNPLPWAIAAGISASVLHWDGAQGWNAPLWKTVGLLADSGSPVALFTIGAVLARASMQAQGHSKRAHRLDLWSVSFTKLLLHPLLVWLVASGAGFMGLELDPFSVQVLILVAALPSASNVVILAERFGARSERIAQIVLITTCLAFFSFAFLVHELTGR